jgi:hypothetical protein
MEASRFDRLTRRLAGHTSRRTLLGASLTGLTLTTLSRPTAAQEATPVPETGTPSFLFVQTALTGTLTPNPHAGTPSPRDSPVPGGGAPYLLSLEGHHGETVFFSDRPERIFGEAPTEQFLAGFGFSPGNPPNAALVAETETGEQVVILELITPAFAAETGTLTYGAQILAEYEGEGLAAVITDALATELPETFGRVTLFIDDCPDLTTCRSWNGDRLDSFPVGPLPGGPQGQCWSWDDLACLPCHTTYELLAQSCMDIYHCPQWCEVGDDHDPDACHWC